MFFRGLNDNIIALYNFSRRGRVDHRSTKPLRRSRPKKSSFARAAEQQGGRETRREANPQPSCGPAVTFDARDERTVAVEGAEQRKCAGAEAPTATGLESRKTHEDTADGRTHDRRYESPGRPM